DGLVRADALPLVFKALGCEPLPRGTHVRLRITGIDLLTLDLHAGLLSRLDAPLPAQAEAEEGDDADEEAQAAAPLSLAIDVADAGPPGDAREAGSGDPALPSTTEAPPAAP